MGDRGWISATENSLTFSYTTFIYEKLIALPEKAARLASLKASEHV